MTTLVFHSDIDRGGLWARYLKQEMPDLVFRAWDEPGDDADVSYALVWKAPHGALKRRFPNLRAILSLGAGVDHVFADPDLPPGVPVIRMVDPMLRQGMVEYALLHALRLHRLVPELEAMQRAREWRVLVAPPAQERTVGVMGLGVLGGAIAQTLAGVGFRTRGWARRPKELAGVECFAGAEGLKPFLGACDILICVLPMTPETKDILNADLFACLPKGAGLINMGRGGQQVEADILAALDSGQLSHAVLDVFQTEPLPQDHPFWTHPKVTVTPHVAAITHPSSGAKVIAGIIADIEAGREPPNRVDREAGY